MRVLIVLLFLPLTGCASAAAIAIDDAIEAHDAVRDYVRDVHDDRQWIRDQCKSILDERVQDLREEGDSGAAAALLAAAYPPPVTVELLEEGKEVANEAYLCSVLNETP